MILGKKGQKNRKLHHDGRSKNKTEKLLRNKREKREELIGVKRGEVKRREGKVNEVEKEKNEKEENGAKLRG